MFNFRKIGILMLAAALFCILQTAYAQADNLVSVDWEKQMSQNQYTFPGVPGLDASAKSTAASGSTGGSGQSIEECQKNCKAPKYCARVFGAEKESYICMEQNETPTSTTSTNATQPQSAVTGCSSNQGIFSGLIATGSKVFNGLRDLIYVVAGFGIIGVAVGGFFGNLNWKWLGAIVISLVVIATTGELISAITGCENFTTSMITDTLK